MPASGTLHKLSLADGNLMCTFPVMTHILCGYCTKIKPISRSFQYGFAKYKKRMMSQLNNKCFNFVTSFEGGCRIIIRELSDEHLKLRFVVTL